MGKFDRFPLCPGCGTALFTDGTRVNLDVYCAWCAQQIAEDEACDAERAATYRDDTAQTCPSRDFLVRQAVLNALDEMFPASIRLTGAPATMRKYLTDRGDVAGSPLRHSNPRSEPLS